MASNSPQEQLMLELINRGRMNPAAEAARFGISLNQGLAPGTISTAPKQVLAMNDLLNIAADHHSNWMLINDQFEHNESAAFPNGRTGLTFGNRMTGAGYTPITTGGENIAFIGFSGAINATSAIIDEYRGLFLSHGHRQNMLNVDFREVGIGQRLGPFTQNGTTYNSSLVTQDFGLTGTKVFVTGVVYNDTVVNDNFFTVGEQVAGRAVTGPGASDTTGAGGGYELGFAAAGAKTIGFHLATGVLQVSVTVAGTNIKIDAVNGHEIWANANVAVVSGPITELHALGIQGVRLTGGAASERLFGNAVSNTLIGGGGNDTLTGGNGKDTETGGAGNDFFVFNSPLSNNHTDKILDFNHVADTFRLENSVMTALGAAGALNANFFFNGAAAHDANDHVIYNQATGALDYDTNGTAAGGVTHLAVLTTKPVLAANDFVVI